MSFFILAVRGLYVFCVWLFLVRIFYFFLRVHCSEVFPSSGLRAWRIDTCIIRFKSVTYTFVLNKKPALRRGSTVKAESFQNLNVINHRAHVWPQLVSPVVSSGKSALRFIPPAVWNICRWFWWITWILKQMLHSTNSTESENCWNYYHFIGFISMFYTHPTYITDQDVYDTQVDLFYSQSLRFGEVLL